MYKEVEYTYLKKKEVTSLYKKYTYIYMTRSALVNFKRVELTPSDCNRIIYPLQKKNKIQNTVIQVNELQSKTVVLILTSSKKSEQQFIKSFILYC